MNTTTKAAHAPTPKLRADGVDLFIESPHGLRRVASFNSIAFTVGESELQAARFAHRFNAYDALVKALEKIGSESSDAKARFTARIALDQAKGE